VIVFLAVLAAISAAAYPAERTKETKIRPHHLSA
jgi:hypothetical protein